MPQSKSTKKSEVILDARRISKSDMSIDDTIILHKELGKDYEETAKSLELSDILSLHSRMETILNKKYPKAKFDRNDKDQKTYIQDNKACKFVQRVINTWMIINKVDLIQLSSFWAINKNENFYGLKHHEIMNDLLEDVEV